MARSGDDKPDFDHHHDSDNHNNQYHSVDVSCWTNGEDSDSHQKRSDIIHQMLEHQCLEQLRTSVESGWDVNEELIGYDQHVPLLHAIIHRQNYVKKLEIVKLLLEHGANPNVAHMVNIVRDGDTKCVQRTALHEALRRGWTELVKMLLDAGAKFKTSDGLENPLVLAFQKHDCPTDLLKLLLKHGAGPNDHAEETENVPLLNAIKNCSIWYDDDDGDDIDYGGDDDNDDDDDDEDDEDDDDDEDEDEEFKVKKKNVKVLLEHGANPNVAYSVNIGGCEEATWVERTALDEAATLGLVDVVKILLDAGAKCTTSFLNQMGLILNTGCHPDLIELMLKQGADPNHHGKGEGTPLLCAVTNIENESHIFKIVQLLLEFGANPDIAQSVRIVYNRDKKYVHTTPLHAAAMRGLTNAVKMLLDAGAKCVTPDTKVNPFKNRYQCSADTMELLLRHGADLHYVDSVYGTFYGMDRPLVPRLALSDYQPVFPQREFDLVFLHGGNINTEDAEQGTVLEYATHRHSVRWLIRHGADTALDVTMLKAHLMPNTFNVFPEIPLILLQAGMRVSYEAQTQLSNMEIAVAAWLQGGCKDDRNLRVTIEGMWDMIEEAKEDIPPRAQHKKSTFPEYFPQQMVDLQEFSDKSLQVYPDEIIKYSHGAKGYRHILNQIRKVLEFLSQPQSLQWYCRRSVRENLVSLQPSVVKSLLIPAALKRYILCHEI